MVPESSDYFKLFYFWRVIALIVFFCIIGILLYSYVFPLLLEYFPFTHWLVINETDRMALLEYTWSVQGALSAITIAMLTLLAGFIKDRIYGIRFLEYVTRERPKSHLWMNIWEETAVVILITAITYIFVAKEMMATVVFLFFISITLIIDLVYRNIYFVVFSDKSFERVEQMLLQSVLHSIDEENRG